MKYIWLILILILVSCYNEKKALSDVNKAAVSFPDILAKKARDMFPCVTTKSSIDTVADSAAYKAALNKYDSVSINIKSLRDSISKLPRPDSSDTVCYRIIDQMDVVIGQLRNENDFLKSLPPTIRYISIHDTVLDEAALKACQFDESSLIAQLAKKTKEADEWHAKANKRGIQRDILAVILGIGGYLFFAGFIRRKAAKLKAV